MMNWAVEVEGLVVRRGAHSRRLRSAPSAPPVLRDVSVRVPMGSVTGLLGPSGCGKSTLLRAVMGVQRVAAGSVRVLGVPAGSPALRSQIGYMTQAPSVYADLTVRENLSYFAAVLGVAQSDGQRVADLVDLTPLMSSLVSRLSGGQRSRVSLAVALFGKPALLVLDEPTVGLDPVLRRDLWSLFRALADGGTTLLISSHVMDEAARCDSLLLMREGQFLFSGTPDELLGSTGRTDVEEAFLALVGTTATAAS